MPRQIYTTCGPLRCSEPQHQAFRRMGEVRESLTDKLVGRHNIEDYRGASADELDAAAGHPATAGRGVSQIVGIEAFSQGLKQLSKRARAPMPPMRGPDIDPLSTIRFYPTTNNATAWKHKRMRSIVVYDGQFKVTIKWRSRNPLPLGVLQYRHCHMNKFR